MASDGKYHKQLFSLCAATIYQTRIRPPPAQQYDIELVHNIEEYTGSPLSLCPDVAEDDVLKLLNSVSKASRVAKMRLMEQVRMKLDI